MRNKYIHFSLGTGDFCTFTVVCLEAVGVHVGGGGGGLVQNLPRIRFSVVQLHDFKKTGIMASCVVTSPLKRQNKKT